MSLRWLLDLATKVRERRKLTYDCLLTLLPLGLHETCCSKEFQGSLPMA